MAHAWQHRIPGLGEVTLEFRYQVSSGLCNQHYAHITALAVARALRVDVVQLPPPVSRQAWVANKDLKWTPFPFDELYDYEQLAGYFSRHGEVRLTHAAIGWNGAPKTLGPLHKSCSDKEQCVVPVPRLTMHVYNLDLLVAKLRADIDWRLHTQFGGTDHEGPVHLHLVMPDVPLLGLEMSDMDASVPLANALAFAPALREVADGIVDRMARDTGMPQFDALHLRIEGDVPDLWREDQDVTAHFGVYASAAQQLGFGQKPLYVASGIWTPENADTSTLVEPLLAPLGSALFHKELFVSEEELSAFNPEQRAAIDLLVMLRSRAFVGNAYSTFSMFVRELRASRGVPRSASELIMLDKYLTHPTNMRFYIGTSLASRR